MKKLKRKWFSFYAFVVSFLATATFAYAEVGTGVELNFNPTEMFKWTQMIIDVMMPVLYISLGISLAFLVVRALKSAFS